MKNKFLLLARSLFLALLLVGATGCDTFEDILENEKEASGVVEEVGTNFLVMEAIRYEVNDQTTYDGLSGLSDIQVGSEIEVEYTESGSTRTAVEIEAGPDND